MLKHSTAKQINEPLHIIRIWMVVYLVAIHKLFFYLWLEISSSGAYQAAYNVKEQLSRTWESSENSNNGASGF